VTAASVDVVIPVRDVDRWLPEAVGSALDQDPAPGRVVVVDAGSRVPVALPAALAARCQLVRSDEPLYPGAARNLGLARCTADHVGFLDADDLWPPGRMAVLLDAAQGADWTYGMVESFAEDDALGRLKVPDTARATLPGGGILRTAVVRAVGGFDGSLAAGEFVDLAARLRAAGAVEVAIDAITLRRRIHSGSTTARQAGARSRSGAQAAGRSDYLRVVRAHLARHDQTTGD
jgi:glycosyltransferase involved in cell wall biosynthesis